MKFKIRILDYIIRFQSYVCSREDILADLFILF